MQLLAYRDCGRGKIIIITVAIIIYCDSESLIPVLHGSIITTLQGCHFIALNVLALFLFYTP